MKKWQELLLIDYENFNGHRKLYLLYESSLNIGNSILNKRISLTPQKTLILAQATNFPRTLTSNIEILYRKKFKARSFLSNGASIRLPKKKTNFNIEHTFQIHSSPNHAKKTVGIKRK